METKTKNKEIPPLLDLKIGQWITDGKNIFQWIGPAMGTKGCWKCDENGKQNKGNK